VCRLSDARQQQALPLLDVGTLIVGVFNDCFGVAKDLREGQLNIATMVGRRRAIDIHNMLVDWLEEETEAWLDGADEVGIFSKVLMNKRGSGITFQ
jgi:hypothetical protein